MALALPRYDLDERHHQHLNPFSAHNSSSSLHGRAHSIDMSIELEHQLQLEEEFTTTTTTNTATATTTNTTAAMLEPRAVEMDQRVSLDPVVLSGIVANLRESMEELTKERDVLADTLGQAHAREADLKEALALVTERCEKVEAEVEGLRKKSQDDEEAISLLRSKVEESRRGLMRLQSESKRMSQINSLSIDAARSPMFFGSTPPSAKRASFTPLTGSGATHIPHRRTPSVSDGTQSYFDRSPDPESSPNAQIISLPDDDGVVKKGRRASGFFSLTGQGQRMSPPSRSASLQVDSTQAHVQAQAHDQLYAQIEALTKERDEVKTELAKTRRELTEAQDAREASEHCATVLRQFISANQVGESTGGSTSGTHARSGSNASGIKLPRLPTEADTEEAEEAEEERKSMTSWALKLWRVDTSSTSNHSHSSSADATPQSAAPRKPWSIFGSRSSTTTTTTPTTTSPTTPLPSPSHPAPHSQQQEPMFNGSDCSSIDESEPNSPAADHAYRNLDVMVREASRGSTTSSVVDADHHTQVISFKDVDVKVNDNTPLVDRDPVAVPITPTVV